MKMYCEDCEYYSPATTAIGYSRFAYKNKCLYPENATIDQEKNEKWGDVMLGAWQYSDYLEDVVTLKRHPKEINKDNDCAWFQPAETKWWEIKKRRRIIKRYGK